MGYNHKDSNLLAIKFLFFFQGIQAYVWYAVFNQVICCSNVPSRIVSLQVVIILTCNTLICHYLLVFLMLSLIQEDIISWAVVFSFAGFPIHHKPTQHFRLRRTRRLNPQLLWKFPGN